MNRQRIEPGEGLESVWDYPRPPALQPCSKHIQIIVGGVMLVDTNESFRVLETSHPPVYYVPQSAVQMDLLRRSRHGSFCEWKGHAYYYDVEVSDKSISNAAWSYPDPSDRFSAIAGYLAFYPSKMETCYVDGERVKAQEGDFYGGWITDEIVGPFKGGPGSMGW